MSNKDLVLKNYKRWYENLNLEKEKKVFRERLKQSKPKRVYIELTPRCNFNCIMCLRDIANLDYPDMSFEQYKRILSNLSEDIYIINFTGFGENSLNKEFSKILEYTKEKGYYIEHTSNGSIFDIDNIKFIDTLVFSLDGIDSVKEIRKGISNRTIETIKNSVLYKKKHNLNTKIGINMVLSNKNIKDIDKMFNFCEENDLDFLMIASLTNTPSIYGTNYYKILNNQIKECENLDRKNIVNKYINGNFNFDLTIFYPKKTLKGLCTFLFEDFQINSKGELILCCRTQANPLVLGNLYNEKMDDILNKNIVKRIKKAHLEDLPFELCDRCNYGAYDDTIQ